MQTEGPLSPIGGAGRGTGNNTVMSKGGLSAEKREKEAEEEDAQQHDLKATKKSAHPNCDTKRKKKCTGINRQIAATTVCYKKTTKKRIKTPRITGTHHEKKTPGHKINPNHKASSRPMGGGGVGGGGGGGNTKAHDPHNPPKNTKKEKKTKKKKSLPPTRHTTKKKRSKPRNNHQIKQGNSHKHNQRKETTSTIKTPFPRQTKQKKKKKTKRRKKKHRRAHRNCLVTPGVKYTKELKPGNKKSLPNGPPNGTRERGL